MSKAGAQVLIKNLIREIAQECATRGQVVSETLVAFIVKAVVLDPQHGFNVDRTLTRDDIQRLIKFCVERLLDRKSPSLDTVKMQVYFDMNYVNRDEFFTEHRRVLEQRLAPLVREVTDARGKSREELESLYRKIVSVVLLRSGLGAPTDIGVVREATAALQSVFPQTELATFQTLHKRDKERQLLELSMLVTGIRLFNKDAGKGGEGIDDLPAILNEAIPATTQQVDAEIQAVLQAVARYTALLEHLLDDAGFAATVAPSGITARLVRDSIINARQHEAFLRVLLGDLLKCAQQVELLEQQLAARMDSLRNTVQNKTAVPTAQVYPQFVHLSQVWTGFQDEMVFLSVLTNSIVNLEPFGKTPKEILPDEVLLQLLGDTPVRSDDDRIHETSGVDQRVLPQEFADNKQIEWLFPDSTKNLAKLKMQFKGFCGHAMVKRGGILLPGNPHIGIMHYRDSFYVFSSKKAAYEFARNPDFYIHQVADLAKASPELIQLLELHAQFASVATISTAAGGAGGLIEKPVTRLDVEAQTDTHLQESNIVKSYEWNEWELRRQALKLANLRRKVTRSMQTNLSNLRRDNCTQVYLPKEKTTQTKTDATTSVPKPSVFYYGLRGHARTGPTEPAAATVLTAVDLTLNVDAHLERSIPIPPATASATSPLAGTGASGEDGEIGEKPDESGEPVERSAEENEFYAMLSERLANGEDISAMAPDGDNGENEAGEARGGGEEEEGVSAERAAPEAVDNEGAQTERSVEISATEGGD